MEIKDSVSSRKRKDSNGGSSDSDLSDSWNFVDQADVTSNDAPSSDGESVEILEPDNDSHHNDAVLVDNKGQLAAKPDSPVDGTDSPTPSVIHQIPEHEAMFDSSFCWFLLFATSAVLVSNLAFMVAENALDWSMDMNFNPPSFLRDLPVTAKHSQQDHYLNILSWADDEEVAEDTVVDSTSVEEFEKKNTEKLQNSEDEKHKYNENSTPKWQKESFKINNHEIGKYFKTLSDISSSAEAQNKFAQSLLILDTLHMGLNDLEEVGAENTELHQVLKNQKDKLNDVLTEVEFGVARSLTRLATNVLNKVQTLERRFENQWCKMERNGYKEELKGLFYDCHGREEKIRETETKYFEDGDERIDFEGWNNRERRFSLDGYHFEVDKDSTGKMFSRPYSGHKGINEYYQKLVKSSKKLAEKYAEKHKNKNTGKLHENKNNYHKDGSDGKGKRSEHLTKDDVNQKNREKFNEPTNKFHEKKNEKPSVDKSSIEMVSKYLSKKCEKNQKSLKMANKVDYKSLKNSVAEKIRISKHAFDALFEKYCKPKSDGFHWDKKFQSENLKGDYNRKNNDRENLFKEKPQIIEEHMNNEQNIVEIRVEQASGENDRPSESTEDKIIVSSNQPRQWILSYEHSPSYNKTNVSGDWFIKAGESRSKVRWANHRSDWWFDRASHRRHPSQPPSWFLGKRKNWFFMRAWFRQRCRQSPHAGWCHVPQDESITIPSSSSNFR